ncbi:O-unit flippase-like protein [Xenorhabdus doucetiae]|uniref:O-antigen/teichoic acid export membrane protein n=1 Tax=Xenorhabdus doucetiae TaxID=351671 RepID=A0A068QMX3_9GAMM|nr:O-unit flippase-like protein [Xenorhabdus doucetiae]TYP07804.1 O-antigen/teichoic acid export membrane protein [Xenorhabdus doucetiae]CDG15881.1 putative O-antigen flippase [Xenorhabdus doucetiae]
MVSKKDIIIGYTAQLLNVGSGIIILPALLIFLSKEELGLWYIFSAMYGLILLLEVGFQPTISRQSAYICDGAVELRAFDLPEKKSNYPNIDLFCDLFWASKKIYMSIAILSFFLLSLIGSGYLISLKIDVDYSYVITAWLVYSISAIINFYFGYYNGLLLGMGEITNVNMITSVSKFLMVVFTVIFLWCGAELYSVGIASLLSCIINRILISRLFNKIIRYKFCLKNGVDRRRKNSLAMRVVWSGAWRLGLVQLGTFVILKGNQFIAATFIGVDAAGVYGLTSQVLLLIFTVSSLLGYLQLPKMNSLQLNNNLEKLRDVYSLSVLSLWFIFISATVGFYFFGIPILRAINSTSSIIDAPWFFLFAFILLLEANHGISGSYLTTLNKIPFLTANLISGFFVISLSIILVKYYNLGIYGLIMGQGIVQLAFNNWYWPLLARKHLKLTRCNLLYRGFLLMRNISKLKRE